MLVISNLILANASIFAQEQNIESLKTKIDQINEIIDKASIEFDYETWSKYYVDDFIILPNGEPLIQGKAAFIENERKFEEAGYIFKKIETSLVDMFSSGNLVHEIGKYKVTLKVPGVPYDITDIGKYLVIWEIQTDGSLKIKLETWNNDIINR
jgi:ketosteroid isomerase-like protein